MPGPEDNNRSETTTDVKLANIAEDVATIKEVLLGNGDIEKSLVVRFTRLEDSVGNCQKIHSDRNTAQQMGWKIITTIVCCALSSITAIVVALIK